MSFTSVVRLSLVVVLLLIFEVEEVTSVFTSCYEDVLNPVGGPISEIIYEMGVDENGNDCLQLTVSFSYNASSYAAVGFQSNSSTVGMLGLDVFAFDTESIDVYDYNIMTGNAKPQLLDTQQDATVVSVISVAPDMRKMKFYRKFDTQDVNDFKIEPNVSFTLAYASGLGTVVGTMPTWVAHQKQDAGKQEIVLPVISCTPASFTSCSSSVDIPTGVSDFDVAFEMGFDSQSDPAIQFTVSFPSSNTVDYAAIGISVTNTSSMTGLDIYAFDSNATDVQDFNIAAANGKPSVIDIQQDGVIISSQRVSNLTTVVFYRKLTTGDTSDVQLNPSDSIIISYASGKGSVFDQQSWTKHIHSGAGNFTLSSCATSTPSFTPCTGIVSMTTGINDLDVDYEVGFDERSNPAIQFTVSFPSSNTVDYAAIGISVTNTSSMTGLDIYAFDSNATDVQDFNIAAGNVKPTVADVQQDGVFVSSSTVGNMTTVVFYRMVNTLDVQDEEIKFNDSLIIAFAIGEGSVLGTVNPWSKHSERSASNVTILSCQQTAAPDTLAPTSVPATPPPSTLVPTPAPPSFTPCTGIVSMTTGINDLDVDYEVGFDELSNPAIQFTVSFPSSNTVDYAAIGISVTNTSSMTGLDIYAFDSNATDVQDFNIAAGNVKPTVADVQQDGVFVSSSTVGNMTTVVFYRMVNTLDVQDEEIKFNDSLIIAFAIGEGSVLGTVNPWSKHSERSASNVTILSCQQTAAPDTLAPTSVPATPPPSTLVPTPAPPSFTPCTGIVSMTTGINDLDVDYEVGFDELSNPAIQFTVSFPSSNTVDYAAIGISVTNTSSMTGLDIYAFDSNATDVQDFNIAAGNVKPTVADVQQDGVFVSSSTVGNMTTVVFYRMVNTLDVQDEEIKFNDSLIIAFAIGEGSVLGTVNPWSKHSERSASNVTILSCQQTAAPDTLAPTSVPATPPPSTLVPTPAPPSFTPCTGIVSMTTGINDLDVDYEVGFDELSNPAIQFTVSFPSSNTVDYAAIGISVTNTSSMTGLDIYAFDSNATDVQDFNIAAGNVKPTVADVQQDGVFVSSSTVGNMTTVVFYRMVNTLDVQDEEIKFNDSLIIAFAIGEGSVLGTVNPWSKHSERSASNVTILSCQQTAAPDTLAPTSVPATPPPSTLVPTPAPPSFTPCTGIVSMTTGINDLDVDYEVGFDELSNPAIQFTVSFPSSNTVDYAAIGISVTNTSSMTGLDIYAFDSNATDVQDFNIAAGNVKPTVADVQQDGVFVSSSTVGNMTTVVFYRMVNTLDVQDEEIKFNDSLIIAFAIGEGSVLGTVNPWSKHSERSASNVTILSCQQTAAPDTLAPTSVPATPPPSTLVPTPAPPSFTPCTGIVSMTTGINDLDVDYEVGFDELSNPAIQFTVSFPSSNTVDYAAIGISVTNTSSMTGLDIYAFDSNATDVQDFNIAAGNVKPTVADVQQDGVFVSSSTVGNMTTVVFYRKVNTIDADDVLMSLNKSMIVAVAYGAGSLGNPLNSWQKHTESSLINTTFAECAQTSAPDTLSPTGVPTAIPTLAPSLFSPCSSSVSMAIGINDLSIDYVIGTDELSNPAIQFNVTFPSSNAVDYAAIGIGFGVAGGSMVGMDIYAFDSITSDIKDFNIAGGNVKPTIADLQQDGVFVSRKVIRNRTSIVFYRKIDTGDPNDNILTEGVPIVLSYAIGQGSVLTTWQQHSQRSSSIIIVTSCATAVPTSLPTQLPTFLPTDVPTAAPRVSFVSCGVLREVNTSIDNFNITIEMGTDEKAQPALQVTITFPLSSTGVSYGAVGFKNNTTGMRGLDIYGCDSDVSRRAVSDFSISTGNVEPDIDPQQDGTFVSKDISSSVASVVFFRLLNTSDVNDTVITINSTMVIGFAIGQGTVDVTSSFKWTKHTAKGFQTIFIPSCNFQPTQVPTVVPSTLSPNTTAPITSSPPTSIPTVYLDTYVDTEPQWVLAVFSLGLVFCLASKLFCMCFFFFFFPPKKKQNTTKQQQSVVQSRNLAELKVR